MHLVADLMSSPVITIEQDASAQTAAVLIAAKSVRHLVVLDRNARVVGVLSDRDIREARPSTLVVRDQVMRDKALAVMHVRDVMTGTPSTVDPNAPAIEVLRLMKAKKIGSVPVTSERGVLVGIVTGM